MHMMMHFEQKYIFMTTGNVYLIPKCICRLLREKLQYKKANHGKTTSHTNFFFIWVM